MGRKTGSKRKYVTERFAVPETALRSIDSTGDLQPGEVVVTRQRSTALGRVPFPPRLAWEVWRLRKHKKFSSGQVARIPNLIPAPSVKSRESQAKRYLANVNRFLATPEGLVYTTAQWWGGWIETGRVDPLRDLNEEIRQAKLAQLERESVSRRR